MPIAYRRPDAYPTLHRPLPFREPDDDRLQLLRSILADRRWSCPPCVRAQLLQVLASAAGNGSTSEHAWMTLAEELARYLLYRRTGQQESALLEWQRPRHQHRHAMAQRCEA